ncbi:hypothetical protein B0H12DRAFT_1237199 [Mycena haematopus]|nr:hypothetical protein B0H12DRAFT_1237199 [Mycena haematopus]
MSSLDAVVSALGLRSAHPSHAVLSHAYPLTRRDSITPRFLDPSGIRLDFDVSSLPSTAETLLAHASDPRRNLFPQTRTKTRLEPPSTFTFAEPLFGLKDFTWCSSQTPQPTTRDRSASPPRRVPRESRQDQRATSYDDRHVSSLTRT